MLVENNYEKSVLKEFEKALKLMTIPILLLILVPLILWVSSMYMLSDWNKFIPFFIANGILIVGYVLFLIYGKSIGGHDEYGLGFFFRLVVCLLTHVLVVFIFAIIKNRQLRKQTPFVF